MSDIDDFFIDQANRSFYEYHVDIVCSRCRKCVSVERYSVEHDCNLCDRCLRPKTDQDSFPDAETQGGPSPLFKNIFVFDTFVFDNNYTNVETYLIYSFFGNCFTRRDTRSFGEIL